MATPITSATATATATAVTTATRRVWDAPRARPAHAPTLGASVVAATTAMAMAIAPVSAAATARMYVGAGDSAFLEREYVDLKYAGVMDVVPGTMDGKRGVEVTYEDSRLDYATLMRVYWRHAEPTQTNGQFGDIGDAYAPVIYVSNASERAVAVDAQKNLETSGIFGDKPCAIPVVDGSPKTFEPDAESERNAFKTNPKAYEKTNAKREQRFKELWGYVQFCKDRVCGYVRFAPKCTSTCLKVFPEYLERNSGVPTLDGPGVKITKK